MTTETRLRGHVRRLADEVTLLRLQVLPLTRALADRDETIDAWSRWAERGRLPPPGPERGRMLKAFADDGHSHDEDREPRE
jgi:hypothetical protein